MRIMGKSIIRIILPNLSGLFANKVRKARRVKVRPYN